MTPRNHLRSLQYADFGVCGRTNVLVDDMSEVDCRFCMSWVRNNPQLRNRYYMVQKMNQEPAPVAVSPTTRTAAATELAAASPERYPECAKFRQLKPQVELLEDFLEWLSERYYRLEPRDGVPIKSLALAVPEFLEIDVALLEEERQRMIDEILAKK